jgi:hypothetical protein
MMDYLAAGSFLFPNGNAAGVPDTGLLATLLLLTLASLSLHDI